MNAKETSTLVAVTIDTPCEHHRVHRGPACKRKATVGFLFHARGKLGRCYCEEHNPRRTERK